MVLRAFAASNLDVIPSLGLPCWYSDFDFCHKLLLQTLLPLGVAVSIGIIRCSTRAVSSSKASRSRLASSFFALTYLTVVSTSATLFRFFDCSSIEIPDEDGGGIESFLSSDVSIDCKSARYTKYSYFAMGMVLIFPIGIPFFQAVLLWRHRTVLRNEVSMNQEAATRNPNVGHLTFLSSYRSKYWYFDLIENLRKLFLASVLGTMGSSTANTLAGLGVSVVCLHFFGVWQPYKTQAENTLGIVMSYALVFLFFAALVIKTDLLQNNERHETIFGWLVMSLLGMGPVTIYLSYLTCKKDKKEVANAGSSNRAVPGREDDHIELMNSDAKEEKEPLATDEIPAQLALSEFGQRQVRGAWANLLDGLDPDPKLWKKGIELLFYSLDICGLGEIGIEEFEQGLESHGVHLNHSQVEAFLTTVDADGNGTISLEELLDASEIHRKEYEKNRAVAKAVWVKLFKDMDKDVMGWTKQIEMIFTSFDKAGTGEIPVEKFVKSLTIIGVDMDAAELRAFVEHIDQDGNGTISLGEFNHAANLALETYDEEKSTKEISQREQEQLISKAWATIFEGAGSDLEAIEASFRRLDKSGTGDVSVDHFILALQVPCLC